MLESATLDQDSYSSIVKLANLFFGERNTIVRIVKGLDYKSTGVSSPTPPKGTDSHLQNVVERVARLFKSELR